ncbi:hypothetical protein ACNSOP_01055 [Aliarcobacter lanthieri]|uniref:hypothetical protein n=1 Tax=Aliarcobacter lanthieri TaxID=1355374 RepID=UPI003AAA596D
MHNINLLSSKTKKLLKDIETITNTLFSLIEVNVTLPKGIFKYYNNDYEIINFYINDEKPSVEIRLIYSDDIIIINLRIENLESNENINYTINNDYLNEKLYHKYKISLPLNDLKPLINYLLFSFNPFYLNIMCK